jgi:hypothetical protein
MTRFAQPKTLWTATVVALFAAALSAAAPAIAVAEDNKAPASAPAAVQQAPDRPATPAPAAATPSSQPQPAAVDRPGFLHELGSWWDGSIAYFNAKMKDARGKFEDFGKTSNEAAKGAATATQEAMKNAVDVSKDAASAVLRLPNTRVVEMRERCDKAANGAPDCYAAAVTGCRAKGFTGGKSLDVSSAETCPAATLLSRQKPGEGECPVETVVTRAVCQ